LNIKVYKEAEVTAELDQKIKNGLCRNFPQYSDHFSNTRIWNGVIPALSIVVFSDENEGSIIAHLGIIQRNILVNRTVELSIFGIQNVFIQQESRGQGILNQLMKVLIKAVDTGKYDCGLLFCIPELEKIYSRFDWMKISNTEVIAITEDGLESPIPTSNIAMFHPLKIREFPKGILNLQGMDW